LDLKGTAAERRAEVGREPAGAGLARIGFEAACGRTRLARLEQRAPLRVLFARVAADEPVEAVLLNTGGGIVGGDRLAVEAGAGHHSGGREGVPQRRAILRSRRRCRADRCRGPGARTYFAVHPREALCAAQL
jgi:hypothetical protein